jgi:hypothetical protein
MSRSLRIMYTVRILCIDVPVYAIPTRVMKLDAAAGTQRRNNHCPDLITISRGRPS